MLVRQLTRRFGRISAAVRSHLTSASPEQLDAWAERILDAANIDDVFTER